MGKTDFERNIDFENAWQQTSNVSGNGNSCSFKKEFQLDIENDKVYLLQISSPENILQLQLNKVIVAGIKSKGDKVYYNITDQLKMQNTIELTSQSTLAFEAKIHCINKLFIQDIEVQYNAKSAWIEVKVRNAFNTEKQGTLEYTLYSAENKKIETKETPIFISGNAENIYHQEFKLNLKEMNLEGLKVICKIYFNGKLFDKIVDDL